MTDDLQLSVNNFHLELFSQGDLKNILISNLSFYLQAACFMVKNILMALSLVMTKTPVECVTVMEGRSSAPRCSVMESAATLTNHLDNAVENVNVC